MIKTTPETRVVNIEKTACTIAELSFIEIRRTVIEIRNMVSETSICLNLVFGLNFLGEFLILWPLAAPELEASSGSRPGVRMIFVHSFSLSSHSSVLLFRFVSFGFI